MYDIVIIGGRVMDPETKLDALRNVGIKDGKIAIITSDKIEGKETIDANGQVVAPGFIDMHHHNSGVPFGEKCAMRDGITTPLELEVGVTKVKEVYNSLEGKCRLNYGFSSSTMPTREIILNPDYKSVYSGDFLYDIMGNPKKAKTSMKWSTEHLTAEQDKKFEELLKPRMGKYLWNWFFLIWQMTQESFLCPKNTTMGIHIIILFQPGIGRAIKNCLYRS